MFTSFRSLRRFRPVPAVFVGVLLSAAAGLLGGCTEASTAPGEDGAGDFEVVAGVRYSDTLYTPMLSDYQAAGETGYYVTGRMLRYQVGDSAVGSIGFLQVTVGAATPVSAVYEVAEYSTGNPTAGKVQLYTWGTAGGMSWTDEASTGNVKLVVTSDSVQAIGKDITLANGKKLSFNLKVARPAP